MIQVSGHYLSEMLNATFMQSSVKITTHAKLAPMPNMCQLRSWPLKKAYVLVKILKTQRINVVLLSLMFLGSATSVKIRACILYIFNITY